MMKAPCRLAALASAAVAVNAWAATTYTWNTSAEDPDGVITNSSHFYNGTTPAALADITPADTVNILTSSEAAGEKRLSIPADVDYSGAWYPVFRAYDNKPVTYDGPGIWRQSDISPSAAVKYGNSAHFALQSWSTTFLSYADNSAGGKTNGAFRLENAKFRMVRNASAGGSPTFDLDRGIMDFYTPNDVKRPNGYLYTAGGSYPRTRFAFHEGSTFKAPTMLVYASSVTNEIVFDGGADHFINKFQVRPINTAPDSVPERTRLTVTGEGTKLSIGSFSYSAAGEHRYRVSVTDGATLAVPGWNESITQVAGDPDMFVLTGGGNLVLGDSAHAFKWKDANFTATNGVVDTTATGVEAFFLTGTGNASLKDSVWRSTNVRLDGTDIRLRFDGGAFSSGSLFVAHDSNTSADFVIDGGGHSITNVYVAESSGCSGVVALSNGTLTVGSSLYFGRASSSTGTGIVSGGTLAVGDLIVIGGVGNGELAVSGGSVSCKRLGFVWNDAARNTSNTLRLTGGEMTVDGAISLVAASGSAGCSASVVLDGGVLTAGSISGSYGCSTVYPSKTGTAALCGDGGKLRAAAANGEFLQKLNSATCGAKGLTIESDYDIAISQGFANAAGEAGELILAGSGVKTLSGTTTVSRIVVAGGTAVFADGARATSELVVTNGAKIVFSGDPGDVGLTGLALGDAATAGVLDISAGQTIAVDGDVVINKANVNLVGDFAFGSTNTLLTATGSVSAQSAAAWADALISSGALHEYSYDFTVSSSGGTTSLKMTVADVSLVLVQETGTRDYASEVSIGANARMLVAVSNAAALTVSGKVAKGALRKVGEGKFYLTNGENRLLGGIVSEEGLFSVPTAAALGYDMQGLNLFTLKGGTLEFTSAASELYSGSIVLDAGSTKAAVVKNIGDLTVGGLSVTSGDFVKRGAGRLVVEPKDSGEVVLSRDNGTSSNGWDPSPYAADLDDSGMAPTGGYMGLNVAEGVLVLKGDASTTYKAPNCVMVGMCTAAVSTQPELVVDGAKANLATSALFQFCGYQTPSTAATRPRFTVINGADVSISTFMAGRVQSYDLTTWPTTTVDNATLTVSSFRGGYHASCNHGIVMRNGARLYASSMLHYGPTYFDVTNSVVQKNANGDCTEVSFNAKAGKWMFRAGSYLALKKMTTTQTTTANGFTLSFDGGTWETGGGEYQTFHLANAETYTFEAVGAGGLTLPVADGKTVNVARAISGDGPIVKTGAGTLVFEPQGTWDSALTTKTPLDDSVSLATTGPLDVREGSVTIQSGACRSGGVYRAAEGSSVDFSGSSIGAAAFSGAGTFTSATVMGGAIKLSLADDGTIGDHPSFTGVTFQKGVRVDFGRVDPLTTPAEGVVVATFPNGAPNVSGWRSCNTGKGTRATFRVAANGKDVLADIAQTGAIFIVY